MEENDKLDYLMAKIQRKIDSFNKKRTINKTIAFVLRFIMVSFGASTTVLLGLKGFQEQTELLFRNIALIISACLALLSAFEAFFNHKELWVRYTITATMLMSLKAELEYVSLGSANDRSKVDYDSFFERYQSIMTETNEFWSRLRSREKSTTEQQDRNIA